MLLRRAFYATKAYAVKGICKSGYQADLPIKISRIRASCARRGWG